mmetsp:Transcript_25720/g.70741  ORF Transcript_25720/g.70741 Transcript_25720/m.70741 type:complete len:572 (+) Transcript_25720:340-2055(+)
MAKEIENSSGGSSGSGSPSFYWTTPWSWVAGLVRTTLTGSKRKREYDDDDDPDSKSHSRSRFRSALVDFRELLSAMEKREEELERLASEREANEERRFRKIEAMLENALQELSSSVKKEPMSQPDGGSNSEEEEQAAAKEEVVEEEGNDDDDDDNNDNDNDESNGETNGEKDSNDADAELDVDGLLAGTATPPPGLVIPSHAWLVRYVSLRRYQSEHGDCNPRRTDPQYPGLGAWVSTQRCNFNKRKTIRRDSLMFSLLDEIGFDWGQQSTHRTPPPSSTALTTAMTPKKLLATQPSPQDLGKTPKRPKSTPNQNYNKPSTLSDSWLANFERLKDYKLKHGNCNPRRSDPECPGLGVWVSNQRCNHLTRKSLKKGSEAFVKLESIGFEWDPLGSTSASGSAKNNNKNPPAGDHANDQTVSREDPASGASAKPAAAAVASSAPPLSVAAGTRAGRSARVSILGMPGSNSLSWEQRLAQLVVFKEDRCGGDLHLCAGRHDEVSFPGLRSWMCEQRSKQKMGLLNPERYTKLDAIGFDWRPQGPLVQQQQQQQQRRTSEVENLILTASAWQDMV